MNEIFEYCIKYVYKVSEVFVCYVLEVIICIINENLGFILVLGNVVRRIDFIELLFLRFK